MFNSSDFGSAKYTMADFKEWAGEVANDYLKGGITPNTTIEKIAKLEELKPFEIETLAAESNKMIHQVKFASADVKYHAANFPLADAKEIVKNLQNHEEIKVAHFVAPEKIDMGPDAYEMFGVQPEEMDKTASVKHEAKNAAEKTELLMSKLADEKIDLASQLETAQHTFIKQARQYCLQADNSSERMKVIGLLDHFTKCAESKQGKQLLNKLAHVLAKEGKLEFRHQKIASEYFEKEADCKAPQELISENLDAQIVNGSHPLYITLQTVDNVASQFQRCEERHGLVEDRLRILKQKIRAL